MYGYFTVGFLLIFVWIYLFFYFFSPHREIRFQQITHWFYRGFFRLAIFMMPWVELRVGADVRSIRSSVIISNHQSYLDPLLLISLFSRHKTIVKNSFFHVPFFSWVLKTSGYIPSGATGKHSPILIHNLNTMQDFLSSGGNLFIFPEGTRSLDGTLAPFNKGGFTIARKSHAPIQVIRIRNSNRLLHPKRFAFNATEKMVITVERLGTISEARLEQIGSLSRIIEEVRSLYSLPDPDRKNFEAPA
jgi:1-acyl-sn-glycerol-3-phosphate acyltransferase